MSARSWPMRLAEERAFWDGLDVDYLLDFAGRLSEIGTYELGFRPAGSRAGHRAGELIAAEMRALELQRVRKEPFPVYAWDFGGARLELENGEPIPAVAYPPTPGTPAGGLSATLVDAGHGTGRDYVDRDVQDKIAFVRFDMARLPWIGDLGYEAELRGARAVVFYYLNGYGQHESGEALSIHNGTARATIPILQIGKRHGARITERLAAGAPVRATIHSQVEGNAQGTGYNVVGEIPGRLTDRYMLFGAHYDAWFHGFRDNAVGVASVLSIARTVLDCGYQPEHTLVFIATDAEEFGAEDTYFDWLIGCYRLMEAHPEWHGKVSAAFNIDGLGSHLYEQLGFAGVPELLPFLRQIARDYQTPAFPNPQVWVGEQLTAWNDALTYAYFGAPPAQARLRPWSTKAEMRRTIYHSQFDNESLVDAGRTADAIRFYGAVLMRLDGQPVLPYDFATRAQRLREALENPVQAGVEPVLEELEQALDALEEKAEQLAALLDGASEAQIDPLRGEINDRLCAAAAHLVENINYLGGAHPGDALPLHTFYERDLRALDAALDHLSNGDAGQAIAALTDREHGLRGACYAPEMSYPAYHRFAVASTNPARQDLFWAGERAAMNTDVWVELQALQDKLARERADFGPEQATLQEKRERVAAAYRQALLDLLDVVREATARLPLEEAERVLR